MRKKVIMILELILVFVQIGIIAFCFYYVFDGQIVKENGEKLFAGYHLDESKSESYSSYSWIIALSQVVISPFAYSLIMIVLNKKSKYWIKYPKYTDFYRRNGWALFLGNVIIFIAVILIFGALAPRSYHIETKSYGSHTTWDLTNVIWYYFALALLVISLILISIFLIKKIMFLIKYKKLPEPNLKIWCKIANNEPKLGSNTRDMKKLKLTYFWHLPFSIFSIILIFYNLIENKNLYTTITATSLALIASIFCFVAWMLYIKQNNIQAFTWWNLATFSLRMKELWKVYKSLWKFFIPMITSLLPICIILIFMDFDFNSIKDVDSSGVTIDMKSLSEYQESYIKIIKIIYYLFLIFALLSAMYLVVNTFYWCYSIYKKKSWISSEEIKPQHSKE